MGTNTQYRHNTNNRFSDSGKDFAVRVQKRDIKLFEYLYKYQCMTSFQLTRLLDMNKKVCERRLRKLCKDDYLRSVPVPNIKSGRSPYLYYLGEQGAALLNVPISKPRFTLQLTHQQKNTELLIEIILSFKSTNIQCQILPEHLIRTLSRESEIIPDGAIALKKDNKQALFLLENCSGTEIIKSPTLNQDIETKFVKYAEMFKNNDIKFYENFFEYDFKRFRLLFIANNNQRMESISKVAKKHDSNGFIWLTTLNQFVKHGIAGNIWQSLNKSNLSII